MDSTASTPGSSAAVPAAAMITNAAFTNIPERILRRVSTILRYRNNRFLRLRFIQLLIFVFWGLLFRIKLHRRSMSVISLTAAILIAFQT
jgi:hypothetical protein